MNSSTQKPVFVNSERDADGRLVSLVYDSNPPMTAPDAHPWLVAVDGSENSMRALTHAARQAAAMQSCSLHLVQVQHWLSKEAAETELANRALETTARVRGLLDSQRLPWRLHVAMGDPAERILDRAAQLRVTTIIMGSRGLGVIASVMLGSVTYKVMHLARVPVTVVP